MKSRLQPLIVIAVCALPGIAAAQGLMPGNIGQNQDQPVKIEAASFVVQDRNKTATFSGDVHVVQGSTTMKCQSLVVFYQHEVGIAQSVAAGTKQASAAPSPKGTPDFRRIECRGGVKVATRDQKASSELGVYDMPSKTITMTGNVIVSQGENVIHGERVIVDTVTGSAHVEGERVRALIQPNKNQNGGPGNKAQTQ